MKRFAARLLLIVLATVVAFAVAELVWRCVRGGEAGARMYFRDAERRDFGLHAPLDLAVAADREFLLRIEIPWPGPMFPPGVTTTPHTGVGEEWFGEGYEMPRPQAVTGNVTWRPGAHFFICYTGARQDYFDGDGCVEYRFNRFGIRDRDDLTLDKPAGVRRVVCLGDSFTLGWGVRQEHGWPVLVENELRKAEPTLQVINCGGAGSAYVDEYELALRHRHGRFHPDVVLVTLCLNDLLLTNGKLCHMRTAALPDDDVPDADRPWWSASRLLSDLARRLAAAHALDLDPQRNWVDELEHLPADHLWYRKKGETPDCYWVSGKPQQALHRIHEWCDQHGAVAAVVVWPFLQSLDVGAFYPFTAIHDAVRDFCAAEGAHGSAMPFLDLLPALRGQRTADLWVSPADMHPNERAQRIVAPALADFVAGLLHGR